MPAPPATTSAPGQRLLAASPWLVIALAALVVLATVRHYAVSFDEAEMSRFGENMLAYLQRGCTDAQRVYFGNLFYYGPWFETLAAWLYSPWPAYKWEIRHLVTATAGLLTLVAVARLARDWRAPVAALAAVLALALQPSFWGNSFLSSKDIPFAAAFAWAMLAIARAAAARALGWRRVLSIGLAIGLCCGLRVGGFLLYAFGALAVVLVLVQGWPATGPGPRAARWRAVGVQLAVLWAWSWLVMVLTWPWALGDVWHHPLDPLVNPLDAFTMFSHIQIPVSVLFAGRLTWNLQVPWYYVPQQLLITGSLPALALAATGVVAVAHDAWRDWRSPRVTTGVLVTVWALFPPLYCTITHASMYDGCRHLLFIQPAVALLAGRGILALVQWPVRQSAQIAVGAVATLALLWPLPMMVRLHPYEYSYYNELVGGPAGAEGRYDTDYWLTSLREAAAWVKEDSDRWDHAISYDLDHQVRSVRTLVIAAPADHAMMWEPALGSHPHLQVVPLWRDDQPLPEHVDYYIGAYRNYLSERFAAWPVVHRVERAGVVFAVVRKAPTPGASTAELLGVPAPAFGDAAPPGKTMPTWRPRHFPVRSARTPAAARPATTALVP